jgi:uncharacterized protein (DUF58 family)
MVGRKKLVLEFILLILLVAAGLIFVWPELLLFSLPFASHLLLGTVLSREFRPKLQAERTLSSPRLVEGENLSGTITLKNRGKHRAFVGIVGDSPLIQFDRVAILKGEGELRINYEIRPKRGLYRLSGPYVWAADPVGFWVWEGVIECQAEVWVYPRTERVPAPLFSPRITLATPGGAKSRCAGPSGINFYGTRPFLLGDDPRRLNWKALARREELVINLYEEPRTAVITVILDARAEAYAGQEELLELGILAAGSISRALLADGHRVGLLVLSGGVKWINPGFGRHHAEKILLTLAQVELQPTEAFPTLAFLPWEYFPKGSGIVAILPLRKEEVESLLSWRGKGLELLVLGLVPSPRESQDELENLAARFLRLETNLALHRLWAGGVRAVPWDGKAPLGLALRPLSREKLWSRA